MNHFVMVNIIDVLCITNSFRQEGSVTQLLSLKLNSCITVCASEVSHSFICSFSVLYPGNTWHEVGINTEWTKSKCDPNPSHDTMHKLPHWFPLRRSLESPIHLLSCFWEATFQLKLLLEPFDPLPLCFQQHYYYYCIIQAATFIYHHIYPVTQQTPTF